jgi:hypothetical protein
MMATTVIEVCRHHCPKVSVKEGVMRFISRFFCGVASTFSTLQTVSCAKTALRAKWLLVVGASVLLSGCSMVLDKEVVWENDRPEQFPVLRAVGYAPLAEQSGSTVEQRTIQAMKASKLEAYKELAEQVYGQKIGYKVNMQQAILGNEQFKASLQGVIRGARVVKSYPVGEFYATEMELDFKTVYDLYQNTQPVRRIKSVKYY